MDLQNVKNITIPEGSVNNIHDKDGKLLWGRLAYDTKYAGDTYQQTYSGKNLWSFNTGTFTNNSGINQTVTKTDNSLVLTAATTTGAQFISWITPEMDTTKTYTISGKAKKVVKGTDGQPYIRVGCSYSDDGTTWSSQTSFYNITDPIQGQEYPFSYTLPSSHKYYRLRCYNNASTPVTVGEQTTYYDLQLEQSDSVTSYEPYVGGTASPNPDYPQDVQVVTGEQTVWVHGKNMFDTTNYTIVGSELTIARNTDGSFTVNGTNSNNTIISFQNNINLDGDYTLATIGEKTPTNTSYFNLYSNDDLTGTITSYNLGSINHYKNFSSSTVTKSQRILLGAGTYNNFIIKPILVKGTYDLSNIGDYEPYQGQSYTVDLGATELCKIGDYQDYIYKSGDDWYVHKDCGKVVLNGSEASLSYANGVVYGDILQSQTSNAICDYYIYDGTAHNTSEAYNKGNNKFSTHDEIERIYIRNDSLTSLANWQTWLSTHNTTVYYAFSTPTDTKITDNTLIGQLNAIHKWLTRYGYLSSVTGNLPMIINQNNL